MFERFNKSARAVVFRARDNAAIEGSHDIEPHHILIALGELHPELLASIVSAPGDAETIRRELRLESNPSGVPQEAGKERLSYRSKQVLVSAIEEAQFCWQKWEQPRRRSGAILPEDLAYWEARLNQPIRMSKRPGWFGRWILRRKGEVDERHLLLGLLKSPDCPLLAVLTKQGVTLAAARQRLCATAG